MWVLLLLLLAVSAWCYYLAKKLIEVHDEKIDVQHRHAVLFNENVSLHSELDLERSLSSQTRKELDDAFKNLELVLDPEKFPGENSGEKFRYPDWSNPPGMIRQPTGITEADRRESTTPMPQVVAAPIDLKRGYW
jgi:hypothetical protein